MSLKIRELSRIYFCTGARNHDLLKHFPEDKIQFEYDERMAAFRALGYAKGTRVPAAICTTSGTAVSECVSALLEAKYSDVPLVLISGDRPGKMHGTGAPQTVQHEPLTVGARGSYFEISLSEFADFEIQNPIYPVHINVLVDDTKAHEGKIATGRDLSHFEAFLGKVKKPLFLISHEAESMRPFILKFAGTNLPYYAEVLSGGHDISIIRTEKKLIDLFKKNEFDGVIRVGHTPLSKVWRLLEINPLPVFSFDSRNLPGLSFGDVSSMGSRDLMTQDRFWKALDQVIFPFAGDDSVENFENLVKRYPASEVAFLKKLQDALPYDGKVYLGNSLIIRFFEMVQTKRFQTSGNRGVNGIDGQLATAIGIADSTKETVYCILGDITTRYDLSAIAEMPKNLKLIIINNRGGRIFDMLKLDKRIVLEHERDFSAIVPAMGLTYSQNLTDLKSHQVIELRPSQEETEKFLSEWI
ncbi:MAG: thiamine pyrophosphate-binding protein [Bdellovibrionota bacterium]